MDPNRLFEIIGKITVENFLLKEEITRLQKELEKPKEDK